jgi:type VI secretion system Hcp family effector
MENTFARSLRYIGAVVSLALAFAMPTTAMADLITLTIPGITGDVTVEGQVGTIEVLSLSGNVQETAPTSLAVFSDLSIMKRLDRSSPALFLALVKGQFLSSAVFNFLHEAGDGFTKTFKITLTNAMVTKFGPAASENNVIASTEQISFKYQKIQLKDVLSGQTACWNVASATSC